MGSMRAGWSRWNCDDCGALGSGATTGRIINQVETICRSLQSSMIKEPPKRETRTGALVAAERAFEGILAEENFDETVALSKAKELASARYDHIETADYETKRIRWLLDHASETEERDMELLRSIAAAILIKPSGGVDIILTNGQTIGRDGAA